MSEQNDIAFVVLEVLNDQSVVVHRHRVEGRVPQDDGQRLQFTLEVRSERSKLIDLYPLHSGYKVKQADAKNYVPLLETRSLVAFQ